MASQAALGSLQAFSTWQVSCPRKNPIYLKHRAVSGIRAEVQFVDDESAQKLVTEQGYTILDVRDASQYSRAHIPASVHVPLFIENADNDIGTVIKRAAHTGFAGLFYGVAFTKPNPDFVSTVESKLSKDSKLLLVCQEGLRSATAAKMLDDAGFSTVAFINSGLQSVKPGIFPKEGPKELQDAGKVGLVTIQSQISIVLGSVLIAAYLFLQFFPTQAEQLFFSKS